MANQPGAVTDVTRGKAACGHFCLANYFQLSEGPKLRSSFCRVSRRDSQYFTNKSGLRKSYSTAHRQKGLRPLNQACPSGGKIDCGEVGFAASVAVVADRNPGMIHLVICRTRRSKNPSFVILGGALVLGSPR